MWNSTALALSETDYQSLLKSSPFFKEADKALLDAWKSAISNLKPEDKKFLLTQQREWIKNERDAEARELMERGFSKDCAYALVSRRRAGNLKVFKYNQNLSQEDQDAGRARSEDYYYDEDEASKFANGGQCVASSERNIKQSQGSISTKANNDNGYVEDMTYTKTVESPKIKFTFRA